MELSNAKYNLTLNTGKTQLQRAACSAFVTLIDFKENCTFASQGRNWLYARKHEISQGNTS